jgi:hypothetical protein
MSKPLFVIPEFDIDLRLTRTLIIINYLSTLRNKREVLNLEKLVLFDYLLHHPQILYKLLENEGIENPFDLEDYDTESIETIAPNKFLLFEIDNIKQMTKLLFRKQLINIKATDDIYFTPTDYANEFLTNIKSNYLTRLIYLTNSMRKLKSLSTSQLKTKIMPFV